MIVRPFEEVSLEPSSVAGDAILLDLTAADYLAINGSECG